MPFAGYKDFGDCLKDQQKKGRAKDSAQRICGFLQKKHEKKEPNNYQGTVKKRTGSKNFPTVRITQQYYRFRPKGRSPKNYIRFRTLVINNKQGIKAVVGFKKSGSSEIQSYLFLKSKWTPETAKKWLRDSKKKGIKLSYKEDIRLSSNEVK